MLFLIPRDTVALGNDHMTLLIFDGVRLASYKPTIVALLLRKYNLLIRQLPHPITIPHFRSSPLAKMQRFRAETLRKIKRAQLFTLTGVGN
jgi:hypothetical protein